MAQYQLHIWQSLNFVNDRTGAAGLADVGEKSERFVFFGDPQSTPPQTVLINSPENADITLFEEIEINGIVFGEGTLIEPKSILKSADRGDVSIIVVRLSHAKNFATVVFSSAVIESKARFERIADGSASLHGQPQNCFARGTLIDTPHGAIPVEQLDDGDEVMMRAGATQLISWSGSRRLSGLELVMNPNLRPVRIMAGALTGGRPGQDLSVSREHRLLVDDWRAAYLFGEEEILVPAKSLLNDVNVVCERPPNGVEYFHLLMAESSMVCANGLWAETMLPDTENSKLLSLAQLSEIEHCQRGLVDSAAMRGQSALPSLPHHSAAFLAA